MMPKKNNAYMLIQMHFASYVQCQVSKIKQLLKMVLSISDNYACT
jgi:hypothetical protein